MSGENETVSQGVKAGQFFAVSKTQDLDGPGHDSCGSLLQFAAVGTFSSKY
jgi:hypothetical protein